jgi:peptidoglycan/LPS O-acetylase OafA/YrhL
VTAPPTTATGAAEEIRLPRLESLTGLRWWAAFVVFVHHFMNFAPLPKVVKFSVYGTTGVTFFFILSGFVLTWSHFDRDTAPRFYWRRFARIWPLHFVATLLAIPIFYGSSAAFQKPLDLGAIALSVVLLHAWFSSAQYFAGNPASWSLSDELFFYAGFPLVIRRALRRRVWQLGVMALACIAVSWIAYLVVRYHPPSDPAIARLAIASPLYRFLEFLVGVAIACAIRKGWRCRVPVWLAIALIAVAVLSLAEWARHPDWSHIANNPANVANQVTGPFFALLIAAVATRDIERGGSWLSWRPLVTLGQWSYAFYLTHATVVYAFRLTFGVQPQAWSNVTWILPVLLVSVALAGLLYSLIEHPLERRLRAMLPPARRAGGPAPEAPATDPADNGVEAVGRA